MLGKKDYQEKLFLSFSLSQRIPENNFYRQLKKVFDLQTLRQSTVEPVFGTLINFTGMRKINTRGIESANKVMLVAAMAYNLKKLVRYRTRKDISGGLLEVIKKGIRYEITCLFQFCRQIRKITTYQQLHLVYASVMIY